MEREAANFDAGMVKCWSYIDASGLEQVHLLHSSEKLAMEKLCVVIDLKELLICRNTVD